MPLFRIEDGRLQKCESAVFSSEHTEDRLERLLWESGQQFDVCWIVKQPATDLGRRGDLIGIGQDGAVEVWELKRGRAPRAIVAQALEYAAWASRLETGQLGEMARRLPGEDRGLDDLLEEAFQTEDDQWSHPRPVPE